MRTNFDICVFIVNSWKNIAEDLQNSDYSIFILISYIYISICTRVKRIHFGVYLLDVKEIFSSCIGKHNIKKYLEG